MAHDPYSATADFGEHYADSGPPRTSVLAIISLVLSLICFIPGLSAIGSLLGIFALLGISASKGRVKGTGLAIAGIAVGVVVSLLWFGGMIAVQKATSQYVAYGQVITDIGAGSYDAARGQLTAETRALATDEQMLAFRTAYEAEAGQVTGWPAGFLQVFGDFMDIAKRGQQPDNTIVPYAGPMPLAGRFANGKRIVWFVLDQTGQLDAAGRKPAVVNLAILGEDGTLIWLVDPDVLRAGPPAATPDTEAPAEDVSPAEPAPGEGG